MAELYDIQEIEERVILIGISEQDGDDTNDSLDELAELVKTAGAVSVGRVIQNRQSAHPGLYVGTGKVDEIKELVHELDATGIVRSEERRVGKE